MNLPDPYQPVILERIGALPRTEQPAALSALASYMALVQAFETDGLWSCECAAMVEYCEVLADAGIFDHAPSRDEFAKLFNDTDCSFEPTPMRIVERKRVCPFGSGMVSMSLVLEPAQ